MVFSSPSSSFFFLRSAALSLSPIWRRMSLLGKEGSGSADQTADLNNRGCLASVSDGLKSCADCRTTKTPLWRGGPSGPKSLCNACGIRYRKKRRAVMGLKDRKIGCGGEMRDRWEEMEGDRISGKMGSSLKMKMQILGSGQGRFFQGPKHSRLGEEEQAAVLLMALSSGFFYA